VSCHISQYCHLASFELFCHYFSATNGDRLVGWLEVVKVLSHGPRCRCLLTWLLAWWCHPQHWLCWGLQTDCPKRWSVTSQFWPLHKLDILLVGNQHCDILGRFHSVLFHAGDRPQPHEVYNHHQTLLLPLPLVHCWCQALQHKTLPCLTVVFTFMSCWTNPSTVGAWYHFSFIVFQWGPVRFWINKGEPMCSHDCSPFFHMHVHWLVACGAPLALLSGACTAPSLSSSSGEFCSSCGFSLFTSSSSDCSSSSSSSNCSSFC